MSELTPMCRSAIRTIRSGSVCPRCSLGISYEVPLTSCAVCTPQRLMITLATSRTAMSAAECSLFGRHFSRFLCLCMARQISRASHTRSSGTKKYRTYPMNTFPQRWKKYPASPSGSIAPSAGKLSNTNRIPMTNRTGHFFVRERPAAPPKADLLSGLSARRSGPYRMPSAAAQIAI